MTENNNSSEKDTDGGDVMADIMKVTEGQAIESLWKGVKNASVHFCPFWNWENGLFTSLKVQRYPKSFPMETLKHPSHYNPFPLHRHFSKWPQGFREADRQLGDIPEKSPPRLKTALWCFTAVKSTHSYANTSRVTTQLRT